MRYHYEKPPIYLSMYGQRYCCDHPVYNHCTLFLVGERGLAVIQQRYDPETKHTFWAEVDEWLTDPLYLHPRFRAFFDRRAGTGTDGLYPTVTIRQIMWALKGSHIACAGVQLLVQDPVPQFVSTGEPQPAEEPVHTKPLLH